MKVWHQLKKNLDTPDMSQAKSRMISLQQAINLVNASLISNSVYMLTCIEVPKKQKLCNHEIITQSAMALISGTVILTNLKLGLLEIYM